MFEYLVPIMIQDNSTSPHDSFLNNRGKAVLTLSHKQTYCDIVLLGRVSVCISV